MKKLKELTEKRRTHVESCKTNNDNSHAIIAGMYSDPSHFVYELLQNADDAGASKVTFNLCYESLEFQHNGKKLFDFDDIDSITGINASTKKDDVNAIGTFGAGFKSVFAITETPHIYSGGYNFRIVDFIVPEEVEPKNVKENCTVIDIPFDRSDLLPEETYKKMSKRLQELESESLLFLKNIRDVQWNTETEKGIYRAEINGDKSCIFSQVNEQTNEKYYFVFKRPIEIDNTKYSIVVAYQLNADGGAVVATHDPKLFVFFPTKVQPRLKFLVHAPYKTTPNREMIPFEDHQNEIITNELSTLIAESIRLIKEKNLLTVDFLSLLPVDSEYEHPLYRAIFEKVKEELEIHCLLPTSDNQYACAKDVLLARDKSLPGLLDSSDCKNLFQKKDWLNTAITSDTQQELKNYLISVLDIPEITVEHFCHKITKNFMDSKNDEWIVKFYSRIINSEALYRAKSYYQESGVLRRRPIIRLEDDSHVCPYNDSDEPQVYIPSERTSDFKTVKRSISENGNARLFLTRLGLGEPDDIAEIKEFIVPKYQNDVIQVGNDDYIHDFIRVLKIWLQGDEYKKAQIIDLLKPVGFIKCANKNQEICFQQPNNVYFRTDRLLAWCEGNNIDGDIYFIDDDVGSIKNSREFLERLGVRYELKKFGTNDIRIDGHGWHKRSVNGFNPEFYIHGMGFCLENITAQKSIILWSVLLDYPNKLKGYVETRTNQNNPYDKGKAQTSKAMNALQARRWLYGKDSKLIDSPMNEIALDDLHDDYQKEDEKILELVKSLELKLDEIAEFEKNHPELKVVDEESYVEFKHWKQMRDAEKGKDETKWKPEVESDEVVIVEDTTGFSEYGQEDLSGQDINSEINDAVNDSGKERENTSKPDNSKDSEEIGMYGERVANKYLLCKHPEHEVNWLNQKGNIGKGYDFVIKKDGEEVLYYEVKSKIGETPQLFQVSRAQWNWAKKLHSEGRGDAYCILLVSSVGAKKGIVKRYFDPVSLWKAGKIDADPINIKL